MVSALPNSCAHECFIDELAAEAGVDPVEYRLRYLHEPRAAELVRAVAERADWQTRTGPRRQESGGILRGQGFAYALYVHSAFPGFGAAWAAWVAEVEVNRRTGEVAATRITVGHDAGLMINPDGVRHQIHGNVIQSTSRALKERVAIDENALVASREWGAYPIIGFREVPEIDVLMMHRPDQPPLGVGESASVPSAAAIANAIFDATGVRFRSVPFTPDVILAGLGPKQDKPRRRGWRAAFGGAALAVAGLFGWPAPIPPASPPGADVYAASLIEHGRLLAAAGDCAVCHTAEGGVVNAGGRALHTPFGIVYASNITPDIATGIGAYSYEAFARAMRDGIARDGRHLYPAFPYTAFTRTTDADLLALYAYLMAQPTTRARTQATRLRFPANLRPLLAGWNLLFHKPGTLAPDPVRSTAWNRGRYLVDAVGHCGACHTPRNLFGAERQSARFAGAMVDGWEAPPLGARSHAPVPWTEQALAEYLRHGHTPDHGVAAGPMAAVVRELAALPDSDIAAMAQYLASLDTPPPAVAPPAPAVDVGEGARLFQGACGARHHDGSGPAVLDAHVAMAVNSNVHSTRPDNLIRVILDGIEQPALPALGHMPGFRDSLSDAQIGELVRYIRRQFAPGKPAWDDVDTVARRLRQ